jgi:hypothetical protein
VEARRRKAVNISRAELAELKALWAESSIEPKMDPPKPTTDVGEVVLRDVEFEDVALVFDAGHFPATHDGAMANARLLAWLIDHSFAWISQERRSRKSKRGTLSPGLSPKFAKAWRKLKREKRGGEGA